MKYGTNTKTVKTVFFHSLIGQFNIKSSDINYVILSQFCLADLQRRQLQFEENQCLICLVQ